MRSARVRSSYMTALTEFRECMQAALHDLPEQWRKALLLHYGEDQPVTQVAQAVGQSEKEVRQLLQYSRQYLGQRLVEAGCIIQPGRKAA